MRTTSPGRLAVRGVTGTVFLILVVVASLNVKSLPLIGDREVIHIEFAEAGGLRSGDAVMVSGARVGKVRAVRLDGDRVVADIVVRDRDVVIGDRTEARIITVTLLGRAAVELVLQGSSELSAGDTIPVDRTSSPYNLTSTLNQLTETTSNIDKKQLAEALQQASSTFAAGSSDLGPALDGLTALASAVSANDEELRSVVDRADRVTSILAGRSDQVARLLGAGQSLLSELDTRKQVVIDLLEGARDLSVELRTTIRDTDDLMGPALKELDGVVKILNENKQNLQASIDGLLGYATAFNEAAASGPWFDVYIQNLTSPGTLLPAFPEVIP